ncbi:SDR family NAD(P)-dependent oxidoreductase [Streptomyces sp. WZ-12]|uniref:SDR family NAD(P)-dependent oxidoreductase n=1 Tax=Streptomyces sp. WZ-12 TaxID=3030210 RepID=UPI0023812EA2|nr:SDR family NAD(P)-dependent oxidoreductase [Streptomyces sp. WZ-12]
MDPMLDEFRVVAEGLEYREPRIAVVSNVTGEVAAAGELGCADYWVRHVRATVRFADGVRALAERGANAFLEIGPDGVLSALAGACLPDGGDGVVVPVLRKDRPEERAALGAVARLYAAGVDVDWTGVLAGTGGRRIALPTYAFQRERYWPSLATGTPGDAGGLGLEAGRHPLLGAATTVAGSGEILLTGRLSTANQPWLAAYEDDGRTVLPAAVLAELAVRAGDQAGCPTVAELTVTTPLVLTDDRAQRLQVRVAAPDDTGRRALSVHARPDDALDGPWTLHATAELTTDTAPPPASSTVWPPERAVPLDALPTLDGPTGITAAWQRDGEVFVDLELPEPGPAERAFALHPALLDTAARAADLLDGDDGRDALDWQGLTLHAASATTLRVHLTPRGADTWSLEAADPQGAPVLSVSGLTLRTPTVDAPDAAGGGDGAVLLDLDWVPAPEGGAHTGDRPRCVVLGAELPQLETVLGSTTAGTERVASLTALLDGEGPLPPLVLAPVLGAPVRGDDLPAAARATTTAVLDLLQRWTADARTADAHLVIVTRGAVATGAEEVHDLAAAAVWGLVRSAQSEHPGSYLLLDLDPAGPAAAGDTVAPMDLAALLAAGETQVALRGGAPTVARLTRATAAPATAAHPLRAWDRDGTVLITGGTGGLGGLLARHLVTGHGIKHLLLAGRRGPDAPGATALRDELAALGAEVTLAACDVADRTALDRLLAQLPQEHPLTAVVHTAGVLEDATLGTLTPAQLDTVLRPKVDAAWHLHRATRDLDLAGFVLYSSIAGITGGPGQGNYAAGNAFLDALAAHRAAQGLPGLSLAWGPWRKDVGMTGTLGAADLARLERSGQPPLAPEQGLALFDEAAARGDGLALAVRVSWTAAPTEGQVPAVLRALVRGRRRTAAAASAGGTARRLAALDAAARHQALLDLVRAETAAVLGHTGTDAVPAERDFNRLGFDSLMAVELRTRLAAATGTRLPATLVFDHPTPAAVARYLEPALSGGDATGPDRSPLAQLDKIASQLSPDGVDDATRQDVAGRLRQLLAQWDGTQQDGGRPAVDARLEAASADEVLAFIDHELGRQTDS